MDAAQPLGGDSPDIVSHSPSAPHLTVEQVFHDYAPRVYHVARRMLSNDLDAEDVTQDVFLQVARKLPTFRGDSAFPTWLHRVTVNAALAHRRKRAVYEGLYVSTSEQEFLEEGQRPGTARPWVSRPEEALLDGEIRQVIEKAIRRLPETYREVFVLADVEGLSNAEIGERLELGLSAVKSRLHRARQLMREALTPYFEGSTV